MPTYDYKCTKCGHVFETFQSIKEQHLKECPECKGQLKRLIGTGSGILFKGSGFYETDYKRKHTGSVSDIKNPSKKESKN
jgi:putative FmdB family regulatory protein